MKKEEVFNKLKVIVEDIIEDAEFDENTALIEGEMMDSLELINYLTQIEEEFGIEISMDELVEKELGKIGNLVDYLVEKQV